MDSKRRLILSIATICIVALIGMVIILTLIFCSRCTPIKEIDTEYKVSGVVGEISANAYFAGSLFNMTDNGEASGNKKLVFNGNENDQGYTLALPNQLDIELSEHYNNVVLEYKFVNTSKVEEWLIDLCINFDRAENIKLTSYYTIEPITNFSLINEPYDNEYISDLPVNKQERMFVYIKIQIDDINKNADFQANLFWTVISRSKSN